MLRQFAELVNREMFWVVTEVCSEHNLVRRSKIIKQFIKIARKFFVRNHRSFLTVHVFKHFYVCYKQGNVRNAKILIPCLQSCLVWVTELCQG